MTVTLSVNRPLPSRGRLVADNRFPVQCAGCWIKVPYKLSSSDGHQQIYTQEKSHYIFVDSNAKDSIFTRKGMFTHNVTVPVFVKVAVKSYHFTYDGGHNGVCNPILHIKVPVITDTILNFDGNGHGDVMCKQSLNLV